MASYANRRRFPRYETLRPAYAYLGPDVNNVGRVRNISAGGLCIDYVRWNHAPEPAWIAGGPQRLELVVKGEPLELHDIPFQVVHENQESVQPSFWSTNYDVISCGIEFGHLSGEQEHELRQLLDSSFVVLKPVPSR